MAEILYGGVIAVVVVAWLVVCLAVMGEPPQGS